MPRATLQDGKNRKTFQIWSTRETLMRDMKVEAARRGVPLALLLELMWKAYQSRRKLIEAAGERYA